MAFLVFGILLHTSLVLAEDNNSNSNKSDKDNEDINDTDDEDEEEEVEVEIERDGNKLKIKAQGLNESQVRLLIKEKNRLRIHENSSEIPENCTQTGSSLKCYIEGTRTMTITAGKSGNIIVQVKDVNMSTNVTLYKNGSKVYGIFENETKEIKLPDQIRERVRERVKVKTDNNESIELDEDGEYSVELRKESRFLGIFKVHEKVRFHVDAETGEILNENAPWWGFLARDVHEELMGSSCGTVTPGYNDECCQEKGFDYWNSTTQECEDNVSA